MPAHRRQLGLCCGMLQQAGRRAVIMVNDRINASVVRWHGAQIGRRQPATPARGANSVGGRKSDRKAAERGLGARCTLHPPTSLQQCVKNLIVRRSCVPLPRHGLRPCREEALCAARLVEEHHAASRSGGGCVIPVGLVTPVIEDRHVARPVGPAVRDKELRELVEFEISV